MKQSLDRGFALKKLHPTLDRSNFLTLVSILPLLLTAGCGLASATCDNSSMSKKEIILSAAGNLAVQSQRAAGNWVKYASGQDLLNKNPGCCAINDAPAGDNISFPLKKEMAVIIIYKRYERGLSKYYNYIKYIYPCPDNTEFSGYSMSDASFNKIMENSRAK